MKVGMNLLLWTTFVDEKHYGLLGQLKEAGFDGVEIPVGEGDAAHYTKVRAELDRIGLECTTVVAVDEAADPISEDVTVRDAARAKLREAIRLSEILGSPTLCGPFHSAYKNFSGDAPNDGELERSAEVLRSVGDDAKAAGVVLALEPLNRFETYLLNTAAQGRRYHDLVGHPNVKILYDTHHAHIEEKSPEQAIRTLGDAIGHVHVSENDRGTPGTGQVDWAGNFSTLKAIGWDGWLVFEAFSRLDKDFAGWINVWRDYYDQDPAEVYQQGLPFVREAWEKARG